MIQSQTLLRITDNSGGRIARCLRVLKKGTQPRYGSVGDIIVVSIYKLRNKNRLTSKVRRGEIWKAILVRTRKKFTRNQGISLSFGSNAIVLVDKQLKPIATRIIGRIPKELKNNKFSKIISLSAGTV